MRLVERYHTNFVRAGANLSDADKTKLKAMNAELAKLGTQFSQNVLAEVNDSAIVVDSKAELAGLSDEQIAAAAEAAKSRKLEGKYVIALLNTTGQPAEAQLENRALRERLYKASVARGSRGGKYDNTAIVAQVAKLRAERAKMMGYADPRRLRARGRDREDAGSRQRDAQPAGPGRPWPTPSAKPPTCRR